MLFDQWVFSWQVQATVIMKTPILIRAFFLGLVLVASGCKNYAKVRERRPSYDAETPAGEMIVEGMRHPSKEYRAQMGHYIDAAATAGAVLEKNPQDDQARKDYNFAVGRLFEVLHESKLQPWKAPVICPGVGGDWSFSVTHDGKPEHDPSHFRILPADRYQFRGRLVKARTMKDGLGAPMVIASKGFDPTRFDPFIQGPAVYYGVTEVLFFKGRSCTAAYMDPLATETVKFGGHTFPVAADFTAPTGLQLAELKPRKSEIASFLRPGAFAENARLARLQPYDPKKIPILCIHGLGDSQATWVPMIEALRGDATIRQNYQIWFFSYPTGYPYPLMAAVLRSKLDAIRSVYPDHKRMVVIGHSMGGMIARELITDSGMKLWDQYYDLPPDEIGLPPDAKKAIVSALIFKHRPEVARVIYASASHRGADLAEHFLGRLGGRIIANTGDSLGDPSYAMDAVSLSKPSESGGQLKRMPNSIDALKPNNRFVTTMDKLPPVKGVPYHSIIGDRGKGGNLDRTKPVSTDGIVPYWSSHLDGAESELIIPSGHWSNQHPEATAEVRRILLKHLGKASGSL